MSGIGSATSPAAAIAPQAVKGTTNQAQQQTTPATTLSQLPKQANTNENGTSIVLRPLSGGTCPQGYHLVSGAVCIKDLPSAAASTKTTTSAPSIPATTTTSMTKSFSAPTPSTTSEHNDISSTNNDNTNNDNSNIEENFHTKILKSFNKKFK